LAPASTPTGCLMGGVSIRWLSMLQETLPRFHEFPCRGIASIPSVGGVRGSAKEPELAPTPKPELAPSSGVMDDQVAEHVGRGTASIL
jgi:hypothetical protein